ncbi:uncharacterized protein AMSG_10301 [Thecamonas trahens ATCC 50062]|uniref:Uncharacterized protein n=1 Tax=Thecamonas trahens ATCC 50062 TaxID=461836 RepID=A0A0L0DQK1_THETB|nr:hypothetical protein AMSG_10301 [Thecamonas trahens ATCC 50062]KNC54316.1 hypothetical protein AMSG_10301 [Thecamonas trahens ATCC 50062]|eukprot:XP_013753776.1 hypothetical protein AMSG_10301 [Thecamonas trahens ATCC 50062]
MGNIASTTVCQQVVDESSFPYTGVALAAGLLPGLLVVAGSSALTQIPAPTDKWQRGHPSGGLLSCAVFFAAVFAAMFVIAAGFTAPGAQQVATLPIVGRDAANVPAMRFGLRITTPCDENASTASRCGASLAVSGAGTSMGNATCSYGELQCVFHTIHEIPAFGTGTQSEVSFTVSGTAANSAVREASFELVSTVYDGDKNRYNNLMWAKDDGGLYVFADGCMAYWGLHMPDDGSGFAVAVNANVRRRCLASGVLGARMLCGGGNSFSFNAPYQQAALGFDPTSVVTSPASTPPRSLTIKLRVSDVVLHSGLITPSAYNAIPGVLAVAATAVVLHTVLRALLGRMVHAMQDAVLGRSSLSSWQATKLGAAIGAWHALVVDGMAVVVWLTVTYPGYSAIRPGNSDSDLNWSVAIGVGSVVALCKAVVTTLLFAVVGRRLFAANSNGGSSLNGRTAVISGTGVRQPAPAYEATPLRS